MGTSQARELVTDAEARHVSASAPHPFSFSSFCTAARLRREGGTREKLTPARGFAFSARAWPLAGAPLVL
jgi:hypothetical protein